MRVDGATLRVEHGPGHWRNHACFYLDEEHAIFSGDHVLGFGTTQLVDLYDYMATLRRMLEYQPTRCYPVRPPLSQQSISNACSPVAISDGDLFACAASQGHGPCIGEVGDGGYAIEFLERYEAHRQSREDQVVQLLQQMVPRDNPDDSTVRTLTRLFATHSLTQSLPDSFTHPHLRSLTLLFTFSGAIVLAYILHSMHCAGLNWCSWSVNGWWGMATPFDYAYRTDALSEYINRPYAECV